MLGLGWKRGVSEGVDQLQQWQHILDLAHTPVASSPLPATACSPCCRLQRLEGILRAIAQGGVDADSVSEASCCVAQLRQQLSDMQQGQAAVELQLKYTTSASQLAQLQPQLEEQQRLLGRWEGRLGRQLETIVGMQKSALSARSSGSKAGAAPGGGSSDGASPQHTPQSSHLGFRPMGGL